MWKKYKYAFISVAALLILGYVRMQEPEDINFKLSYSKDDKVPMGNYLLFDELDQLFEEVEVTEENVSSTYITEGDLPSSYLFIEDRFNLTEISKNALLEYAAEGNNVFIAASMIEPLLLDTLNVYYTSKIPNYDKKKVIISIDYTESKRQFAYDNYDISAFIFRDSSKYDEVLGRTEKGDINFIRVKFGEGNFYLNLATSAFTNYNMLDTINYEYVGLALSVLPNEEILWDEHYKPVQYNRQSRSPLSEILGMAGLKQAWFVALVSLILYMFFLSKRKQRIIPIVLPHANSSVEFTKTIGQLYFNEKNNSELVGKISTYFFAMIRKKFYIHLSPNDGNFVQRVSVMSGVDEKRVEELVGLLNELNNSNDITDIDLLRLDQLLDDFQTKTI